MKAAVID